jgi:hypothetical protein
MSKAHSWGTLAKPLTNDQIQRPATVTNQDGTATPGYVGVTVVTNAQAISDNGGLRDIQKITTAGAARATKYTATESFLAPLRQSTRTINVNSCQTSATMAVSS